MRRVVAIGIDSMSIELIEQLVAEGQLPHLATLGACSARHRLRSGPGHRHGVLWSQFVTGEEAQLDGEWLRFSFDPGTYEPFQESAHHDVAGASPFWERAGAHTITLDVPRTTISGPGVHVTAWGAHAPLYPRASEPRGLLRELDARFGPHPAYENDYGCGWHDPERLRRLTDALVIGARRRAEIARHLMERFPDWELFVTVMSESHSACELMWHTVDPEHPLAGHDTTTRRRLERVYRAIDDAIGLVIAGAPADAAIVVFSLDGMRSSHGDLASIVLLPELMHRLRFGRPLLHDPDQAAWRRAGCPPLVPRRGRPWRHDLDDRLVDPAPMPWPRRLARRFPGYDTARLRPPVRGIVERRKGARLGALGVAIPPESSRPPEEMEAERQRVDELLFIGNYRPWWPAMRAFALPTFGDAYLRVNLAGRERNGVVTRDEYDGECRALEALVRACRDVRSGAPVAGEVQRLGSDDPLDEARRRYADVIVHWARPIDAIEHPAVGMVGPFPLHRTGTHDDVGFLWASAPGIEVGDGAERSALDVPATLLALLGARPSAAGAPITAPRTPAYSG